MSLPLETKLQNKALRLLSYRPRSLYEIKVRLKRLKYTTPALINQTIKKLKNLDLLDDQKFAEWWVDQRIRHKPKGNIALKSELIKKGIDRSIISSVLLTPEQEQKLTQKLLNQKQPKTKKQAYRLLKSRGFNTYNLQGQPSRIIPEG